jgi:PAS domain S-box-containing protein
MLNLDPRKVLVIGAFFFVIDFMIMIVLPLEELLVYSTPANIAFVVALVHAFLCMALIFYFNSKRQVSPSYLAGDGQDIIEYYRAQSVLTVTKEDVKRADELVLANKEKESRENSLILVNEELAFQNLEKDKRAVELVHANKEKEKRADALILANKELAFQNIEKDKRAVELVLANKEKEKRADALILANKELAFQNIEKDKRAVELVFANKEKDKRAVELVLANKEKEKRADALILANKELAFQNIEKDRRAVELVLANKEKEKRADALILANKELAFQNIEKDKRAVELVFANKEKDKRAVELFLANKEKEKRADALILANKELAFQNIEKDKRAVELVLANREKEKRADALILANKELAYQKNEKDKRADELVIANKEKEKRADELILANKELAFQTELEGQRSEIERVAKDLALLIDTANAPIFGIDDQGLINEWNQQAEKITGFTKNEVIGRDLVADFITDDFKVSVNNVLERALQGEETANYQFPLFTKNGDRVDVLLNSTTRRSASGQTVGVVGVGQDITELNKVRVEQESIAHELTQLIDTANAPIFGIDDQGLVNEWNQQAEKITGFTKDEVMGRDLVADFITDDFKISVNNVLERALAGEETENYEFPLFTKTGDRVDVLLNSTTRRSASGQTVGVVGVGQDITELKKTQSQVIQSSKLASLGEMATSVAHELNQPLNTIRMVASNIIDRAELNQMTAEYLYRKIQRIDEQVVRASKIINHMRMFGRKADENPIELDPWLAMKSVMDLVGEQLRLESIDVVMACDYQCPIILGNEIQLEQVFVNIISNARDAILEMGKKTGRKLTITGSLNDDKKFEISITDTGGGIPEKLLPRIFEPFITSKPMGKGTGLGLSVSYGIIREMNGTITAENVDAGSRFLVTLPLVVAS